MSVYYYSIAQRARFERLARTENPLTAIVTGTKSFSPNVRTANIPIRIGQSTVVSVEEAKRAWSDELHRSHDCKCPAGLDAGRASIEWFRSPDRVRPSLFLRAVRLKGGV